MYNGHSEKQVGEQVERNKRRKTGGGRGKRKKLHSLGPAGRNIFVSNKRTDEKAEKRMLLLRRGILTFVVAAVLTIFFVFIFGYLLPFMQSELTGATGKESSLEDLTSIYIEPEVVYDQLGLPVLGDEINLFVINSGKPATQAYSPVTKTVSGVQVNAEIAAALEKLVNDAADAGHGLTFVKGYVSYEAQNTLYEDEVARLISEQGKSNVMARTEAEKTVPVAGESDYQTGLCVRLEGDSDSFETSQTYVWLKSNMGKYGFVFRYPADKETETGLKGDLRVLRYVGSKNAERMRQLSLSLEAYIAYLKKQNG